MAQQLTSHELLITGRDRHESSRTSESVHPRGNSISSLHDFDEDETLATGTPPNFEREARYLEKQGLRRHHAFERLLFKVISSKVSERMVKCLSIVYYSIDRSILILGFIALSTGIVTYGGTFRGQNVFNGLAHFIKGGIFFWYGLLVLGRYTGSFSDLGWSWNVKPSAGLVGSLKANTPSAEFFESFIIFFYGSTNMFLEHLASWGGPWSAQDLEHESISIMFFGGGLCGMLIESKQIRDFLNAALFPSHAHNSPLSQDSFQQPQTYGFSMNPVPGLIILLLGFMMSSHHQASLVSSMVHKQWGTLFVGAALARGVTYILTYISPPTSVLPSRPPSELIVAFCLISGGLIFMASNKDMVDGMEFYKLNAMFVFTVVMGLTAFLMAWEIVVLAIKGWAVKREHKPWNGQQNPISKTVYRAMGLP
ncbi:hypothetical protein MMC06_001222 [Schaereria dolodes]|nr:hypothetical protein [Schaereria dolodes]